MTGSQGRKADGVEDEPWRDEKDHDDERTTGKVSIMMVGPIRSEVCVCVC